LLPLPGDFHAPPPLVVEAEPMSVDGGDGGAAADADAAAVADKPQAAPPPPRLPPARRLAPGERASLRRRLGGPPKGFTGRAFHNLPSLERVDFYEMARARMAAARLRRERAPHLVPRLLTRSLPRCAVRRRWCWTWTTPATQPRVRAGCVCAVPLLLCVQCMTQASVGAEPFEFSLREPWHGISFAIGEGDDGSPLLSYSVCHAFYKLPDGAPLLACFVGGGKRVITSASSLDALLVTSARAGTKWAEHTDLYDADDLRAAGKRVKLPFRQLTEDMRCGAAPRVLWCATCAEACG
jgi:hypothetical protein